MKKLIISILIITILGISLLYKISENKTLKESNKVLTEYYQASLEYEKAQENFQKLNSHSEISQLRSNEYLHLKNSEIRFEYAKNTMKRYENRFR